VLSLIKCHIHSSKNCCWDYCKFHIIKDERRVSKLEGKTNLGAWNSLTAWPDWPWSPYLTTDLRHCYWPKGVIMISESFALQLELLMDCRRCWFWADLFKSRIDRFCKYHDVRYDYKTEPTGKWVESWKFEWKRRLKLNCVLHYNTDIPGAPKKYPPKEFC